MSDKTKPPTARKTVFVSVIQETNPNGSITLIPQKVEDTREITLNQAAEMLNFRDPQSVSSLLRIGAIRGWKPDSKRGNAKWRINLQSVLDYKSQATGKTSSDY